MSAMMSELQSPPPPPSTKAGNVVIFNSLLLPPSQTFIRDPLEKLTRYTPYYVGSRRVSGLELPADRTLVVNPGSTLGKLEEQVFKFTSFAPRLYRQVQQLEPVLIHAQFGLSGVLMLPWARSLRIPLLVHYRGADATLKEESSRYTSVNHWIYFQRRDRLKQEARLFLTVSKFIRDTLIDQGFPPEKIINHYHGVDVEKFQPDPDVPREPVVLFVGRLAEKKGGEYLVQAMAAVQSQHPEAELVAIGDGPLKAELESLAAKTLKRYRFLGVQPPEVVKQWMNRARVLAAPSVTAAEGDSEGLPNVVQEAMAMALPVVSTFHAGIPEAVLHEETGFLTPERDVDGLAAYIVRLFDRPDIWQTFSTKGRVRMETHFNRARQSKALEDIYDSVGD